MTESDISIVETLCELQLAARRMGCAIHVDEVSAEVRDLIVLAGLEDTLLCRCRCRVEGEEPIA